MEIRYVCLSLLLFYVVMVDAASKPPNIVFILTDDQDVVGGMHHMDKTKEYIGGYGTKFVNMFTTTPGTCPSRSSIFTGKYAHNHKAFNNSLEGGCGNDDWIENVESKSFVKYLKGQNYNTFYAGVYHNQYAKSDVAGGVSHVPEGWDSWFGLVGAAKYFDYDVSVNGKLEHHGEEPEDYFPHLMLYKIRDFILEQSQDAPFLAMIAPPAAHGKFIPAPEFQNEFLDELAPRTPSFNKKATDKHWLVANATSPMSQETIDNLDEIYRNRSRTLLSVEFLVEDVMMMLEGKNLLDNTYIIYTSDNGYHLGQFSLSQGKRLPYEFDIRVPLMVRGPDVPQKEERQEVILNIDFAPTFLEMAGIEVPEDMDGVSFHSKLRSDESSEQQAWRTDFLVEYWGESENREYPLCPEKSHQDVFQCNDDCTCEDSVNNTYSCVRTLSSSDNTLYCLFKDDVGFVEFYDIDADPEQLTNLASTADPNDLKQKNQRMSDLKTCSGESCQENPEDNEDNPNSLEKDA